MQRRRPSAPSNTDRSHDGGPSTGGRRLPGVCGRRPGLSGWHCGGVAGDGPSGRLAELTVALSLADLGTGTADGARVADVLVVAADGRGARVGCGGGRGRARTMWCCCGFSAAPRTPPTPWCWRAGTTWRSTRGWPPWLMAQPGEAMRYFVRHLAEDLRLDRRGLPGRVVRALTHPGMTGRSLSQHCEAGSRLAARVGLVESVCHAVRAHAAPPGRRRGIPERSVRRRGAGGGAGRVGRSGRRVVGAAGGVAGDGRSAGPPARGRLRPAGRRCRGRGWSGVARRRGRRSVRCGSRRRAGPGGDHPRWCLDALAAVADFTDVVAVVARSLTGGGRVGGRRGGRGPAARG